MQSLRVIPLPEKSRFVQNWIWNWRINRKPSIFHINQMKQCIWNNLLILLSSKGNINQMQSLRVISGHKKSTFVQNWIWNWKMNRKPSIFHIIQMKQCIICWFYYHQRVISIKRRVCESFLSPESPRSFKTEFEIEKWTGNLVYFI